ncbi:MAG: hypothetical protein ACPL2D_00640 [Ignavibacteria bacterium]
MFDKFVIIFFYFFLISRFLSEKVKLLPKEIDLINFPFAVLLIFFLIIRIGIKTRQQTPGNDEKQIYKILFIFVLFAILSMIVNYDIILLPASVLFFLGFLEGPILFIALSHLVSRREKFILSVKKLFMFLFVLNVIIVLGIDLPGFIITGNPDLISGTYGNNTYQFSMLLLIMGGLLLGENYLTGRKFIIVFSTQLLILFIFYLSQFRAGLPFFLLAYVVMISLLYGKRIVKAVILYGVVIVVFAFLVSFLTKRDYVFGNLKYEDLMVLLSHPEETTQFGKIQSYFFSAEMFLDHPYLFLFGVGPGGYLSRANYTFSTEIATAIYRSKGVANIIRNTFGISEPYTNDFVRHYRGRISTEMFYGTYQLSNPQSSYLSLITEVGLIGGGFFISLYFYLLKKSIKYFKTIKEFAPDYIPISIALVGSIIYLLGLAVLDNYWEIARVTLPVWLLFWTVANKVDILLAENLTVK